MKSFSSFHPAALLIYFMLVMLITMFMNTPVLLILSLLGAWTFNLIQDGRHFMRNFLFDTGLFFVAAAANPLFSHKGAAVLFFLNGKPITREAVIYGIFTAVMLIAVLNWCRAITRIMSEDKLLYLFGKLTPNLSLVLSMALRYIPLFHCQAEKVNNSQTAMGLYSKDNYIDKAGGHMRVFSIVLTWSLENAVDTANSMRARGYGMRKRTRFSIFRMTVKDMLLIFISMVLAGITVSGYAGGAAAFRYYPKLSSVSLSPGSVSVYIAYGMLALLPALKEIKEKLKWIYCRSRI